MKTSIQVHVRSARVVLSVSLVLNPGLALAMEGKAEEFGSSLDVRVKAAVQQGSLLG